MHAGVIPSSRQEPGAGNLGPELSSHQVWGPLTRAPTQGLPARLTGGELVPTLAWFPKATGMSVSLLINGVSFPAGCWDLTLPSLALCFWGTQQGGPSPHPLKRLCLHILFNLAHSFRAPSPHPAIFLATFLLNSLHSWIRRKFEKSSNKLHPQLFPKFALRQCPRPNLCSLRLNFFLPNMVSLYVSW